MSSVKKNIAKKLELDNFISDLSNIENQYLNLIYHPLFDSICTRDEYERTREMMKWECAICHTPILINRRKCDVENFVCETCKKQYNNKNILIDRRILDSRTKLYKYLEDKLYQQLEDYLNKGK